MPPESGILYRNRVSDTNDPSTYIGVIRVREPDYYPMNETIHRRIADFVKTAALRLPGGVAPKKSARAF
jgi:hypothetical protein